jgi:hypothetical protein
MHMDPLTLIICVVIALCIFSCCCSAGAARG